MWKATHCFTQCNTPSTLCLRPSRSPSYTLTPPLRAQAVLPCAEYYKRQGFPLKKIVSFASNRDFSDLLVFNEDRKEVRGVGPG